MEDAEVIVTGGRGMGDAQNFKLVEKLAAALGGIIGATRPAVEEGWVSRVHQIGHSGKTVAPKLYIACGVSGAAQHVSAIMKSGHILAINTDEDAPIFQIADILIVGDVSEIIPLMLQEIERRQLGWVLSISSWALYVFLQHPFSNSSNVFQLRGYHWAKFYMHCS